MFEKLESALNRAGQQHVSRFLKSLQTPDREALARQIESIDFAELERMKGLLGRARHADGNAPDRKMDPAPVVRPGAVLKEEARREGEAALRAGEVAVLLVAGGQGSRLGFEGPKGCFPIGPVSGASLFEIHSRKILAMGRRYGVALPFYIMTSAANDSETRSFFRENRGFGLDPAQIFFFEQGMEPALDDEGRMLLEAPGRIFMSPDGHGGAIAALERSGALADMRRRGVHDLFYFQVDNPLVEVADPVFIGLHRREGARMSNKVCAKRDPDEGLGVVVRCADGHVAIVEYSELSEERKNARSPDGNLCYLYGSVAIHVFDVDFLFEALKRPMPLHLARKTVAHIDADGNTINPGSPNAFKFEKFIFDVLPWADRVLNLVFEREEEFAPVKNARGADSPETCRRALSAKWTRWLRECGVVFGTDEVRGTERTVEIDPCFALDPGELKNRIPLDLPDQDEILLVSDSPPVAEKTGLARKGISW